MRNAFAAAAAPARNTGREISLGGWDTANVMPADVFNSAIKVGVTTPATFQASSRFNGSISGIWGAWEMSPDNAYTGGIVKMKCPIVSGNATDVLGGTYDLAGAAVYLTVELAEVPAPPIAAVTDKTAAANDPAAVSRALVAAASKSPAGNDPVDVLSVTPAPLDQPFRQLFDDWFNANIGAFTLVFHAVLLNSKAAQDQFQWLKPTKLSYASTTTLGREGFFAALCQTENDPWSQNAQEIDAAIGENLPAGANSVIAISGEKFADKFLRRGAAAIMVGSDATADFDLDATNLIVTNNKDLVWQHVQLDDKTMVSPVVPKGQFSLKVAGDQLQLQFTGVTWKHPLLFGNDVFSLNFTQNVHLRLGRNASGEPVLVTSNMNPDATVQNEAPDIRSASVSVTPDRTAVDTDRILGIIGIATAVIGIGVFVAGKWAVSAAQTAAAAAQVRGAIAAGSLVADVAIDGSEVATVASKATVVEGNLAAAAAFTTGGPPLLAGYATYLTRIGTLVGLLGATSTVLTNINQQMILSDGSLDTNKLPTFDEFLGNVLGVSWWPDVTGWTIKDVKLAKALLLYGDATF